MIARLMLLALALAVLAGAYELGWETGATRMIEHEVSVSA